MFKPPFILSIAGGGSTYTPGIVKSLMVRLQDFPLAEIRLYDIDEARQNTIAPVVEKVIRDHSQRITFTVTSDPEVELVTTDSREVRPGCIFVAFPG